MTKQQQSPKRLGASIRYVAFLRGVNMIGQKSLKMSDLREVFQQLAYKDVQSVQASGNILFRSVEQDRSLLKSTLEEQLEKQFGHKVRVILRSVDELKMIVRSDPFDGKQVTAQTKLLITFQSTKMTAADLKLPYQSPKGDFEIRRIKGHEVYSIAYFLSGRPSSSVMSFLEKVFGKAITTRSWNTIVKIVNKFSDE